MEVNQFEEILEGVMGGFRIIDSSFKMSLLLVPGVAKWAFETNATPERVREELVDTLTCYPDPTQPVRGRTATKAESEYQGTLVSG